MRSALRRLRFWRPGLSRYERYGLQVPLHRRYAHSPLQTAAADDDPDVFASYCRSADFADRFHSTFPSIVIDPASPSYSAALEGFVAAVRSHHPLANDVAAFNTDELSVRETRRVRRKFVRAFAEFMEHSTTQNSATAGAAMVGSSRLLRTRRGALRYDESVVELSDLSEPHRLTQYKLARSIHRRIHIHTGSTNSGKTYAAMNALASARSGLYCGPLRLLAWELADRLNDRGIPCDLVTGQECVRVDGARHTSSTVEMCSISEVVECAVIDEMQMISSDDRGGSWTRALLGVAAADVHVCGDGSMVQLVTALCQMTGDSVTVHKYERLTPLDLCPPIRNFAAVKRGDCIIAFSRSQLFKIKRQIETLRGLKCCIIYGSLPPEARRQQAALFNDPSSGYDCLVASDAVGMGLNLNIGRIIFSSLIKFDGVEMRGLTVSEVKQIAGRAGRYKSEYSAGQVTTLHTADFSYLRKQMSSTLPVLSHAGVLPTLEQIELLSRHKPTERLSTLIRYLSEHSLIGDRFFACDTSNVVAVADALHRVNLTLTDRFTFALSPADPDKAHLIHALTTMAKHFAANRHVPLSSVVRSVPKMAAMSPTPQSLSELECLYAVLDLYVWLAQRYEPTVFIDRQSADALRAEVSAAVDEMIRRVTLSASTLARRNRRKRRVETETATTDTDYVALHNRRTTSTVQRHFD